MFLWKYKLSPWVGVQFKLGASASYHWQYVEPCTVAIVGTTTVQRQRWKAYYGSTPYHLQRTSFETAVGAGKGWQLSFGKFILVDFKPHGVVVATIACQGSCYDTLWKQFNDVLTCLPKVCCLCTIMINHIAYTVIALLDTIHWKYVLHSLYSWTFLHLEKWKNKHTQGQWFPPDNTVKLRVRIRFKSRMSVTARTWNGLVNLSIHYQCLNKSGYYVPKMICFMHLHVPPLTSKKEKETSFWLSLIHENA